MNGHILKIACKFYPALKNHKVEKNVFICLFFRYVLASALRDMSKTQLITEAPKDCDNSGSIWETGKLLFEEIKKQVLLNGATGKVAFDDNGDRINAEYDIVNVQQHENRLVPVGKYFYNKVKTGLK